MRVIFFTVIPRKGQAVTRYISLLLMIGCVCLGTVLLAWMMLRLLYAIGADVLAGLQKRRSRRARNRSSRRPAPLKLDGCVSLARTPLP